MLPQIAREKFVTDTLLALSGKFNSIPKLEQDYAIDLLTPERFYRIKNGRKVTLEDLHDFAAAMKAIITITIE